MKSLPWRARSPLLGPDGGVSPQFRFPTAHVHAAGGRVCDPPVRADRLLPAELQQSHAPPFTADDAAARARPRPGDQHAQQQPNGHTGEKSNPAALSRDSSAIRYCSPSLSHFISAAFHVLPPGYSIIGSLWVLTPSYRRPGERERVCVLFRIPTVSHW